MMQGKGASRRHPGHKPGSLSLKKYLVSVLFLLVMFVAASTLSACHFSTQRYDLTRPVTTMDWLLVWENPEGFSSGLGQNPDLRVRAGDSILGYEAPFENYLQVYSIGIEKATEEAAENSDVDAARTPPSIEAWVDPIAPVMYFLPLYDSEGNVARALLVWREQHNTLIAQGFDNEYRAYLTVQSELSDYLSAQGKTLRESQVYWTWIGALVLIETDEGEFGQFFTDFAVYEGQDLPYDFATLQGQVLSHYELTNIFEAIAVAATEEASEPTINPDENY